MVNTIPALVLRTYIKKIQRDQQQGERASVFFFLLEASILDAPILLVLSSVILKAIYLELNL